MKKVYLGILLISVFSLQACFVFYTTFDIPLTDSHAGRAEVLAKEGKYQEAIDEYELHLEQRLASESRSEGENPYFYKLLIGDLYLELNQVDKAVEAYEVALEREVRPGLTKERFRRLGNWYSERGEIEEGILVLKKYRELDPLLFDLEIDRLHKESLRRMEGEG